MKVEFFEPFPSVLGRNELLPAKLIELAEGLDGLSLELTQGAALIQAVCPEARVWVYEDALMIGLGNLRLADGRVVPKETWSLIRFRAATVEQPRGENSADAIPLVSA